MAQIIAALFYIILPTWVGKEWWRWKWRHALVEKKIDATEIITELGEKGGEKGEAEHRRGSRYTEK